MRLDKYLKVSRLIKRRTVAKEMADKGRIDINGEKAKSSSTVKVGDTLTVHYGQRNLEVKVTGLEENVRKELAQTLYEVVGEESLKSND